MQLKKGQIIELDIDRMAFGGAGIGDYKGLKVFVDGVMPGDKAKASFRKIKKNYAEAKLEQLVIPSKDRCKPKCPYADVCGGCQMQFIPYEMQLDIKKNHVIDCFERIGEIKNPFVNEMIGCENTFYYRNKMEFSFGYDKDMNFSLGLHLPGRRYDILDLEECHLQSDFSVKIVNEVRKFALKHKLLPYKFSCGEGFLRSLFIREGKRTNEVMVNLATSEQVPENVDDILKGFVDVLKNISDENGSRKIVSIYWTRIISKRGVPKQIKERLLHGRAAICEKMILENGDELEFDIFPQAFFQVNTYQAEILYSQIEKMVSEKQHEAIFDLYCGTGTIGLFLAKHCNQMIGVELNEDAVKCARDNARRNNIFNADFFMGDVGKFLTNIKERPSLIVIDPPRAGLTEKIIRQLNYFDSPEIIYVSCNPSTLARDVKILREYGYKADLIQPIDMFPHTFHIENVCLLKR